MPYSDVQICNLALSRVGALALINDLSETSAEAIACNNFYTASRDYVLESAKWPFATRYVELGQVAIEPNKDWGYAYRYPNDCFLAMRLVWAPGRIFTPAPPFAVSGDDSGLLIYCDLSTATLEYLAAQTNSGFFSNLFASALAWRLASEIAIPLGRAQDLADRALSMYNREIAKAAASAFNQSQQDLEPASSFEQARHGGTWDIGYSWPLNPGFQ